ncbi:MAG: hypothetical protein DYG86_17760 [Chloroflexi bacterium CFX2]|nr:hypothetical protein [Chloroflexi bacterium CFX2]
MARIRQRNANQRDVIVHGITPRCDQADGMSIRGHQPRMMGDDAFDAADDGWNGIMQDRDLHT